MSLEEIKKLCENCCACELSKTRTNCVFGEGNPNAELMFVGEAPGETEDLSGRPFVGRAGKLFDRYLETIDIKREDVFIANILKCRPPKNRDPLPCEEEACIGYLNEQIEAIAPKIIVCLGRIAAMKLIKPDFKITAEHGIFFERNNITICAVFHPSALLRDPKKKDAMLIDMQKIKEKKDSL